MRRLVLAIFFIPSLASASNLVTGKFDKGDTVTINRNFRDIDQDVRNSVKGNPFTLHGANGTGATIAVLGANAPALSATTPYTWIDVYVGTTPCTMPVWRKN